MAEKYDVVVVVRDITVLNRTGWHIIIPTHMNSSMLFRL